MLSNGAKSVVAALTLGGLTLPCSNRLDAEDLVAVAAKSTTARQAPTLKDFSGHSWAADDPLGREVAAFRASLVPGGCFCWGFKSGEPFALLDVDTGKVKWKINPSLIRGVSPGDTIQSAILTSGGIAVVCFSSGTSGSAGYNIAFLDARSGSQLDLPPISISGGLQTSPSRSRVDPPSLACIGNRCFLFTPEGWVEFSEQAQVISKVDMSLGRGYRCASWAILDSKVAFCLSNGEKLSAMVADLTGRAAPISGLENCEKITLSSDGNKLAVAFSREGTLSLGIVLSVDGRMDLRKVIPLQGSEALDLQVGNEISVVVASSREGGVRASSHVARVYSVSDLSEIKVCELTDPSKGYWPVMVPTVGAGMVTGKGGDLVIRDLVRESSQDLRISSLDGRFYTVRDFGSNGKLIEFKAGKSFNKRIVGIFGVQ